MRWGHLTNLIESGSYEEEHTDTQEMLEDLLIRMLTREYIDVIAMILFYPQEYGLLPLVHVSNYLCQKCFFY